MCCFVSGPAPQREYRCGLNAVEAALSTLYYMVHAMAAPELFPTGDLSAVLAGVSCTYKIVDKTSRQLSRCGFCVVLLLLPMVCYVHWLVD